MNRKPIIAANWKMNKTPKEAVEFVDLFENHIGGSTEVDIVLAPAFVALPAVKEALANSDTTMLAAQNCYFEESGAFAFEESGAFALKMVHSLLRKVVHPLLRIIT